MTRIGITGGAGYIGSRLAEFLRERGYEVRILDPRRPRVDVTWIPGDVQDPDCLEWFCDSLDYVFDFAAVSGIPPCAREPERCLTTNSWRGPLLSTLARKSPNLKGYLYPSTCAPLFAGYEPGTVVDETTPPRPSSIYGISKWTGEQVVTALARLFSLPVTIFRQSNVYGPSPAWPPASVTATFIEAALEQGRLTIHGSGRQTRSFLYMDDLLHAYEQFLMGRLDGPGPYHILGFPHTIAELGGIVAKYAAQWRGSPVSVDYDGRQTTGSEKSMVYRETRAARRGFAARVDLEEGVRRTLLWRIQRRRGQP